MLDSFKKSLYDHVQMQLQSQKAGIFAVRYIVPIPTRTNVEKAVVVRFESNFEILMPCWHQAIRRDLLDRLLILRL
jgi:alcohol dehydrogenase YqhD (iron-dependent ADH family)